MWIESRSRTADTTAVRAPSDVASSSFAWSPSVLAPSAPEPVPAPVAALPAYVVHDGVRHVPIDVLPWDRVMFRTICGRDVPADEDASGEASTCAWCRRFDSH
jgi:hypothetical protein